MNYKNILAAVTLSVGAIFSYALDLPVKRVSGVDYYYYEVGRNENIADLSKKFNISAADIVRTNPSASDGLRNGMTLYFPVHEFPEDNTSLAGQSSSEAGIDATTRYKVEKGETLYGISRRFNVSPDDIVALNPHVASGVKHGEILLIPNGTSTSGEASKSDVSVPTVPGLIPPEDEEMHQPLNLDSLTNPAGGDEQEWTVPQEERKLRPVDPGEPVLIEPLDKEKILEEEPEEAEPATIAVVLPLMLNENSENRTARGAADFIRGFMLGVRSKSDATYPCNVSVFDSEGNAERYNEIMSYPAVKGSNIIIAQEEKGAAPFVMATESAADSYFLNLFAAHDTTYMTEPNVIQANTPATIMYDKAAHALMTTFADYTPVFLVAKGGKGEKLPFTTYLQSLYEQEGVTPQTLVYEGMLTSADLEQLYHEEDLNEIEVPKYVFIPASGALSEFNKFASALISLRQRVFNPEAVALFGYPDWTLFRNEQQEYLHELHAVIYSRFFCDESSMAVYNFNKQFLDTYGSRPLDQVPSQAALGYDAAAMILTNLTQNEGNFNPLESKPYRGIQSSFLFNKASEFDESINSDPEAESGYVNTTVYIIAFRPEKKVHITLL